MWVNMCTDQGLICDDALLKPEKGNDVVRNEERDIVIIVKKPSRDI